jgi:hypothetical protein
MSKVTKLAEECGITSGNVEKFAAHLYEDGYRAKIRNDDIAALRDHFAGLAMQGVLAMDDDIDYKYISSVAYIMADAMLEERMLAEGKKKR